MELFAGLRDGVEGPDEFAGVEIPGADIAGRAVGWVLLRSAAGDDQIFIDDWGGRKSVAAGQTVHDGFGIQIDDAVIAECGVRFAGFGIQRIELAVAGTEGDLGGSF